MLLFEYNKANVEDIAEIAENYRLVKTASFDVCILGSSEKGFGLHNEIHIWLTSKDFDNANLMILLSYVVLGHSEWKKGQIKIFAIFPEQELGAQRANLLELIASGRLPISPNNVSLISFNEEMGIKALINQYSGDADLTVVGFSEYNIQKQGAAFFQGFDEVGNILFVNTNSKKKIG